MKIIISLIISLFSAGLLAATDVIEGEQARVSYEAAQDGSLALIQKRKTFYLKQPDQKKLKRKPTEITVKAGEVIYILNSEKKITHNIYDESDESWVLTAQEPGDIAAVTFNDKGEHNLKCAIHPKMKLKLIVE
ncbi:cupredoxin domain-containing protein [Vibrio marisflavi]|uniref:Blue (type 1) copper domain-containing protein n=1 Tax=Vibrio marisflavi CECT 7928 TaxID=634439 RepID=A0ABM9A125_9VIBR|nr:plastocyanin/azurin family copper-binding protein [Vibrio marisflavi]CAH0537247.1 hypothetical protein VMF7928_01013 [Vibrio marisflavi CECT 7928]